jgi:CRP-like cAMP-binding protein
MQELKRTASARSQETYPEFTNLLQRATVAKTLLKLQKGKRIFSQGEKADAVYFIQSGKVKITAVSAEGKEAVFAVLGASAFFGEACLTGQSHWLSSATTVEPSTIFRIEKRVMIRALLDQSEFSRKFIAGLLVRILRLEEDVRAQFFYDRDKKLARVLLKIASLSQDGGTAEVILPRWTHETLAKMVNTSRSRVTRVMNRFRKTGLIDYNKLLIVRPKRLSKALLHD